MRARNLKPSFFKNEDLALLHPLARLLFEGLWCMADRSGRLEDRPARIKAEVLPYDECDVEAFLWDLHEAGFIVRYEADARRYIQVVSAEVHFYPHIREPQSTIPAPDKHQSRTRAARLNPLSPIPLTESPICNSSEQQSCSEPGCPEELRDLSLYSDRKIHGVPALWRQWPVLFPAWKQGFPGVDVLREVRRAHAWEVGNPKKRKIDKVRFLTNWLSRQQDQGGTNGARGSGTNGGGANRHVADEDELRKYDTIGT